MAVGSGCSSSVCVFILSYGTSVLLFGGTTTTATPKGVWQLWQWLCRKCRNEFW